MSTSLVYAIKYVADMDAAVVFFKEHLRLKVRFTSPYWSEFDTGPTTLALHPASPEHPAGSCQLGFRVADVQAFHAEHSARGVAFTSAPTQLHGQTIARFRDSEGAECSVSG
ncbi:MAG TPA: VOC family protein [Steroidobacteraceae bacterium]|jgi:lactoylglutathione lyase|nr:VOC family protein [Steroidobacteraceae bacterium]